MKYKEDLKESVNKQIREMLSTLSLEELIRICAYIKELYFVDNSKAL